MLGLNQSSSASDIPSTPGGSYYGESKATLSGLLADAWLGHA